MLATGFLLLFLLLELSLLALRSFFAFQLFEIELEPLLVCFFCVYVFALLNALLPQLLLPLFV